MGVRDLEQYEFSIRLWGYRDEDVYNGQVLMLWGLKSQPDKLWQEDDKAYRVSAASRNVPTADKFTALQDLTYDVRIKGLFT